MDRLLAVILACLTFCEVGTAAERSELPPLIERERFFADPDIAALQISPDGKLTSFIRPHEGTRDLWIKTTAEPFAKARPITAERGTPIDRYRWRRSPIRWCRRCVRDICRWNISCSTMRDTALPSR